MEVAKNMENDNRWGGGEESMEWGGGRNKWTGEVNRMGREEYRSI